MASTNGAVITLSANATEEEKAAAVKAITATMEVKEKRAAHFPAGYMLEVVSAPEKVTGTKSDGTAHPFPGRRDWFGRLRDPATGFEYQVTYAARILSKAAKATWGQQTI